MRRAKGNKYDFILAGGGLQAGLLAVALNHYRPESRVLMVERDDRLCGNHTWSFHESDVCGAASTWLNTVQMKKWQGYDVCFPDFTRRLNLAYCSLRSGDLESALQKISERGNLHIKTGTSILNVDSHSIRTSDGTTSRGGTVIDCRGLQSEPPDLHCGYQKFHGFEIELRQQDWPDQLPTLMDATAEQEDGFRFLYVLPFSPRRVLIEDTHFSDHRELSRDESFSRLEKYLRDRQILGWDIVREERGCLPMPYSAHMKPHLTVPLCGGYAAGWFHAATGYSFPLAAGFAEATAAGPPREISQRIRQLVTQHEFAASFSRWLNRMLFRLIAPEKRWAIFRRFYHVLPDETIKRFYAHRFTKFDAMRIIVGAPPAGLTPFRFLRSFRATS